MTNATEKVTDEDYDLAQTWFETEHRTRDTEAFKHRLTTDPVKEDAALPPLRETHVTDHESLREDV